MRTAAQETASQRTLRNCSKEPVGEGQYVTLVKGEFSNATKSARSKRMIAVCRDTACNYANNYVGQTVNVLLETPGPDGTVDGHTDTYVNVITKTDKAPGNIIDVHITSRKGEVLYGEETR